MTRRESAVHSLGLTFLYLPVGDKLRDFALPTQALVVKISITVPLESNAAKRTGYKKNTDVHQIEVLARFIGGDDLVEVRSIGDKIISTERKVPSRLLSRSRRPFSFIVRDAARSPFPLIDLFMPNDS
jgi:hypothetical protein